MEYDTQKHETIVDHFYVNGALVAGAKDAADAERIYEEAKNVTDP